MMTIISANEYLGEFYPEAFAGLQYTLSPPTEPAPQPHERIEMPAHALEPVSGDEDLNCDSEMNCDCNRQVWLASLTPEQRRIWDLQCAWSQYFFWQFVTGK